MVEGLLQGRQGSPGPYSGEHLGQGRREAENRLDLDTLEGRRAENEARLERNEERARRRREGSADVEEDEELLELMTEDGGRRRSPTLRTPVLQQAHGAEALVNLLVSAGNCGPGVLERTLACVERWAEGPDTGERRTDGNRKEPKKRIGDGEGPDLFEGRQVDADPKLHAVLELGFHLPLTLCTTDALEAVSRGTKQLVMATHHDRDRQKKSVVDVRQWPPEEEMTSEEWRDAWPNLLEILNEVCEEGVYERFRQHHEFLNRQANFKTRFPGILKFDIALRRAYFVNAKCQPFTVGSGRYCQELTQACSDQAVERVMRLQERQTETPSVRYHPYPRGAGGSPQRGNTRGESGGKAKPFQGGRSSGSAGLLCLVCGTSGHKASDCTRTRTLGGRTTFAVWANGRLRAEAGGGDLCVRWNLRGAGGCQSTRCASSASGGHVCSLCGSPDHYAVSKRCL